MRARLISNLQDRSENDLILLAEPADRGIRLDQLEMMYYRALVDDKRLVDHLQRSDPPMRYSNSCRDLSVVISQDYIATHAGIASRAIRTVVAKSDAAITIWRVDATATVTRIDVPIASPISFSVRPWSVLLDSSVHEAVANYRKQRLPNETGGVLLGSFDLARRIVLVSLALPSPEDSKEWPTVYIRGSAGLQAGGVPL